MKEGLVDTAGQRIDALRGGAEARQVAAEKDTYDRHEAHDATRHTTDPTDDACGTLGSREERGRNGATEDKRQRDD